MKYILFRLIMYLSTRTRAQKPYMLAMIAYVNGLQPS
nr:MAG TPA: hypothetical protein [Caudoviricetes sp.]